LRRENKLLYYGFFREQFANNKNPFCAREGKGESERKRERELGK